MIDPLHGYSLLIHVEELDLRVRDTRRRGEDGGEDEERDV
jgi:hypothetical protein